MGPNMFESLEKLANTSKNLVKTSKNVTNISVFFFHGAVALGNTVGNLLGKAFVCGGLSAMQTLGPQAAGAGNLPELYRVALRA